MSIKEVKVETASISIEGIINPADVLLVVSPSAVSNIPLLGLHLLQASCRDLGINTRVLYSNVLYSNLIGTDLHKIISVDYHLLLGERLFAAAAFNIPSVSIARRIHKFLDPIWVPDHLWQIDSSNKVHKVPKPVFPFREWVNKINPDHLESLTNNWLHALAHQIVNIGFPIVGCSTSFGGLLPAVALLNYVKKTDPRVITILGGALCEAEMAEGILSLDTHIDYIFSGEGEITFPALVKQFLKGHLPKEKIVYGENITDLDTIPLPDYQDYLIQREKFHAHCLSVKNKYVFPFETSRGCWYGKCTFCGMNGKRNVFRTKSPDTIIKNLKALSERHQMNTVLMNDTMMPFQYFDTLLPRLSTEGPSLKIVYEMNVDLSLTQVISLKQAGITEFQAGIESLSPSLLRRMRKLHTVRENIALLRYARSAGIKLRWNLLFGLPGDQISEYEEMIELLPLIRHLIPPMQMYPLKLCRFSKYHMSPGTFGVSNLRPAEVFREILPSYADIDKIAYYFTANFPSQSHEKPAIITALWEEFQAWKKAWEAYMEVIPLEMMLPTLHITRKTEDEYILEDTRGLPDRPERMEIDREQANLLLVARPLEVLSGDNVRRAVDTGLGVIMESWFIPLATADPALLQEFERDYEHSRLSSTRCYEKD